MTTRNLFHCVELTCPKCRKMIQMARCQCDIDADHLVEIYRRDILLYGTKCPACKAEYEYESVCAMNRSDKDYDRNIEEDKIDNYPYSLTLSLGGDTPGAPDLLVVEITREEYDRLFREFVRRYGISAEAYNEKEGETDLTPRHVDGAPCFVYCLKVGCPYCTRARTGIGSIIEPGDYYCAYACEPFCNLSCCPAPNPEGGDAE